MDAFHHDLQEGKKWINELKAVGIHDYKVITKTDKGGAVVIIEIDDCVSKPETQ